jgi:hypothetical protein
MPIKFLNTVAVDTSVLYVDTINDRVGIGTTSPAGKLHVSDAGGAGLEINPQTTNDRVILFAYDRNTSTYQSMDFDALDYHFNPSGTEKMRLTNGGNLGIGTTNPQTLLHVKAADTVTGVIKIEGGKNTVTSAGEINSQLDFGSNDASVNGTGNVGGRIASITENTNGAWTGMAFSTFTQSASPDLAEKMRITHDGNVGIGTTTPTSKLHISGTSDGSGAGADAMLHVKQKGSWNGNEPWALYVEGYSYLNGFRINAADGIRGLFKTTSGGTLGFATIDTAPITFTQSNSVEKMRVHSNGFVGIGNTTPKAKLSVEEYGIDTTSTASSATTQIAIHSFAAADFRSARFTVQVTNSTDSTYHTTELLLVHNGTTANITEFGEIHTGSAVEATFDADISSGNVRLLATPASTDTMAFKVVCHSITT